ncbi:MAG TPA: hypothetical protein VNM69_01900 [Bacillus sp. (in: firmicutes)]|nr:hypothetical protein [Bacillus sp. (in: firmicutes)]
MTDNHNKVYENKGEMKMSNLVIKAEAQSLNFLLMQSYPEKVELIKGRLLGGETILSFALYNVGLKRMWELLPSESREILKKIAEEEHS